MSELTPPKRRSVLLSSVIAALITSVVLHYLLFQGADVSLPEPERGTPYNIAEWSPLSDADFSSAVEAAVDHAERYGTHHPGEEDLEFYERVKADCLWEFATRLQHTGSATRAFTMVSADGLDRVGRATVERIHSVSARSITLEISVESVRSKTSDETIDLGHLLTTVVDDEESGDWLVSSADFDPVHHEERELP